MKAWKKEEKRWEIIDCQEWELIPIAEDIVKVPRDQWKLVKNLGYGYVFKAGNYWVAEYEYTDGYGEYGVSSIIPYQPLSQKVLDFLLSP
ncbi:MAG: hypothetical protein QXO40_05750 [Candidatus Aenigmatarchaeota archaeon]